MLLTFFPCHVYANTAQNMFPNLYVTPRNIHNEQIPVIVLHFKHIDETEVCVCDPHVFIQLQYCFKIWDCIFMSANSTNPKLVTLLCVFIVFFFTIFALNISIWIYPSLPPIVKRRFRLYSISSQEMADWRRNCLCLLKCNTVMRTKIQIVGSDKEKGRTFTTYFPISL